MKKWQLLLLPTELQGNPEWGALGHWVPEWGALGHQGQQNGLSPKLVSSSCLFPNQSSGACDRLAKPSTSGRIPVAKESGNLSFLDSTLMMPDP